MSRIPTSSSFIVDVALSFKDLVPCRADAHPISNTPSGFTYWKPVLQFDGSCTCITRTAGDIFSGEHKPTVRFPLTIVDYSPGIGVERTVAFPSQVEAQVSPGAKDTMDLVDDLLRKLDEAVGPKPSEPPVPVNPSSLGGLP